jgi:hypothetical protein
MRLHPAATALLAVCLLIGCTAPSPSPETPGTPATPNAPEAPAAPAPTAPAPAPPASPATPPAIEPAPQTAPAIGANPAEPGRACSTDSDCAVKDVGNCCGYFPMCVNKDAKTDPAAVAAQCAKDGMGSVCGFQEVKGCQCVQGRCENLADGASAAM